MTVDLFHMDCMEYMADQPGGCFDLVITSPPYNLGISSGGGFPKNKGLWKAASKGLAKGYGTHNDAMPYEDYVAWQKKVLEECWRLLSDTGAIFYNHKPRIQNGVMQNPLDLNPELPVRQIVIWKRSGGVNFTNSFYLPTHEWIIIFAKKGFRLKDGASAIKDVWEIPQKSGSWHPAPFPIEIPATIFETTTGTRSFDPFMGSGTTAIAAHNAGVDFVGCEIDKNYYNAAVERFDYATRQATMF